MWWQKRENEEALTPPKKFSLLFLLSRSSLIITAEKWWWVSTFFILLCQLLIGIIMPLCIPRVKRTKNDHWDSICGPQKRLHFHFRGLLSSLQFGFLYNSMIFLKRLMLCFNKGWTLWATQCIIWWPPTPLQ